MVRASVDVFGTPHDDDRFNLISVGEKKEEKKENKSKSEFPLVLIVAKVVKVDRHPKVCEAQTKM